MVNRSRYHAAKCLAQSPRCSERVASLSGACKIGLAPLEQSDLCKKRACAWCRLPMKNETYPCTNTALMNCGKMMMTDEDMEPMATNESEMMDDGMDDEMDDGMDDKMKDEMNNGNDTSNACVWIDNNEQEHTRIVIDIGAVHPGKGWSKVSRHGMKGLVYESGKNHGIDPPGSRGVMCFSVKPMVAGPYFLSAVSYAPHVTEHNDVWVRSSRGIGLWQSGKLWRTTKPEEWIKAYQNGGPSKMGADFKTKDHDGHRFVIPDVPVGENFSVCVSGRSYKYELFRIVLARCYGKFCNGQRMFGFSDWPVSKCIA